MVSASASGLSRSGAMHALAVALAVAACATTAEPIPTADGGATSLGAPRGDAGGLDAAGETPSGDGGDADAEDTRKNDGGADGQPCGKTTCTQGLYCCNASCSLCVPKNAGCIDVVCPER